MLRAPMQATQAPSNDVSTLWWWSTTMDSEIYSFVLMGSDSDSIFVSCEWTKPEKRANFIKNVDMILYIKFELFLQFSLLFEKEL